MFTLNAIRELIGFWQRSELVAKPLLRGWGQRVGGLHQGEQSLEVQWEGSRGSVKTPLRETRTGEDVEGIES